MKKSTIRPPRAPKGEDPAVTIAIQKREIDNLTSRIITVVVERDQAMKESRTLGDEIQALLETCSQKNVEISKLKGVLAAGTSTRERMLGWQDCAREVLMNIVKP